MSQNGRIYDSIRCVGSRAARQLSASFASFFFLRIGDGLLYVMFISTTG